MRLAAVILLFKEQAFIEACVRAIYPVVDSICCASRHDRNFSGGEVAPDQTLEVLLELPRVAEIAGFTVYENGRAMPRFFFAPQVQSASPSPSYRK